jgi:hypothetical protein
LTANENDIPFPSENTTEIEELKYELCKKFVTHLVLNKMTQLELANKLDIDPARIKLFTFDRLYNLTKRLDPNLKILIV